MENWNWRNERTAYFGALQGLTLKSIEGMKEGEEVITFTTECGRVFKMYHDQNCCESVYLADVAGEAACRFDVVLVDGTGRAERIENAFSFDA